MTRDIDWYSRDAGHVIDEVIKPDERFRNYIAMPPKKKAPAHAEDEVVPEICWSHHQPDDSIFESIVAHTDTRDNIFHLDNLNKYSHYVARKPEGDSTPPPKARKIADLNYEFVVALSCTHHPQRHASLILKPTLSGSPAQRCMAHLLPRHIVPFIIFALPCLTSDSSYLAASRPQENIPQENRHVRDLQ